MKRKLDWALKSKGIEILWEDEFIIVLNKPAPMLVLPDRYDSSLPSLYHLLGEGLGTVYVVHRIDKETSGVVVFAKTAEAHAHVNSQFEERKVMKRYLAICRGIPAELEGEISLPLSESNQTAGLMVVDRKSGKGAVTEYVVKETFAGFAALEVQPATGRTHQLRVHLQAIGLPILCDKKYGDGESFFLSRIKPGYKPDGEEKPLLNRCGLHAMSISFAHPSTAKMVGVAAEIPKDMRSVLHALRKYRGRGKQGKESLE